MRKNKKQKISNFHPHNLRFGRFLNKPKFPRILELISNHVNYCDPPLYSLMTPLSFSCGNKLNPGITRNSCFWGTIFMWFEIQYGSKGDFFGHPVYKSLLSSWPWSHREDGVLDNLCISWDAWPLVKEALKLAESCPCADLGKQSVSGTSSSLKARGLCFTAVSIHPNTSPST